MPELTALSKSASRNEIRRIVRSGTLEEKYALDEHCSSVEEMQYVASEYKRKWHSRY
jgi:hypothetical protein